MIIRIALLLLPLLSLGGCYVAPASGVLKPPEAMVRPQSVLDRYSSPEPYKKVSDTLIHDRDDYKVRQITLSTAVGETTVDFYQQKTPTKELVLVFPVLGGRPILSRYFAQYFVEHGIDAAIVHRDNEFKKPERFPELEKLFRAGVIRDRKAIDYFEQEEGKAVFGTFGMSRGAINVAITAGVDKRLQYNIMALGGADLPNLFANSHERRIRKYLKRIMEDHDMTREEFIAHIEKEIITRPKNYAKYIDPQKTLLFLARCDRDVPFRFGRVLRDEIGKPETIYIMSGHKTAVLYTQVAKVVAPFIASCGLPPAYIESEALLFYEKSFKRDLPYPYHVLPWKILQQPLNLIGYLIHLISP